MMASAVARASRGKNEKIIESSHVQIPITTVTVAVSRALKETVKVRRTLIC